MNRLWLLRRYNLDESTLKNLHPVFISICVIIEDYLLKESFELHKLIKTNRISIIP